ncbi:MAG: prepilin-type N-terminal cleavage/methylation domain-containing protein [Gemmatimonadota bacterium]|nr:prepilin-type N-terminal cleavage/methylation domain-containing protein [Gemmatimonadota bacterium]
MTFGVQGPTAASRPAAPFTPHPRSAGTCCFGGRPTGFTLIEVIGALVIFSVGILMVMRVGGALTTQMRYAGVRSQIVALASERLDSIESAPFDSIVAGTEEDTVTVQGWSYRRRTTVTALTPVLARIEVGMFRVDSLGPSHSVTSYTSAPW